MFAVCVLLCVLTFRYGVLDYMDQDILYDSWTNSSSINQHALAQNPPQSMYYSIIM